MKIWLERKRVETYIEYHTIDMEIEKYSELKSRFNNDRDFHEYLLENNLTMDDENHHSTEYDIIFYGIRENDYENHPVSMDKKLVVVKVIQDQTHTFSNTYNVKIPNEKYEEIMKLDEEERDNQIFIILDKHIERGVGPIETYQTSREWGEEIEWEKLDN